MENIVKIIACAIIAATLIGSCIQASGRNIDYVKAHAEERAEDLGLTIKAYEGYKWDVLFGGHVYYHFTRNAATNDIIYSAFLARRPYTDELHLYNFHAINAIGPNN